jgi:hypothetical protein
MLGRIDFSVVGLTQHVQHNGQLADATNRYVIGMKAVNAKGKKRTDEDYARLEDLEWEGGLYLDHEHRVIVYDGPQDLEGLRADPRFRLRLIVTNPSTRGRVARTRPVFRQWALDFTVQYDPDLLNEREVVDMVYHLGSKVGLSDDRRKMGGRFKVVSPVRGEREPSANGKHRKAAPAAV